MSRGAKLVLGFVWLALLAEAFLLSPSARPDQTAWVMRLLSGEWTGEEVWVVALFQLMGIWPFALAALLAGRLRGWPPLWPFALSSMALGAFGLLPGVLVAGRAGPVARWQQWIAHPAWRGLLAVSALGLMVWGGVAGSPSRFAEIWQTDQFVHVMTLDFFVLWFTSIVVARENGEDWRVALVPLFGALWVANPPELRS